ncbi:MAG: SRPBCC family protein [Gammaproteobacteria bacterium]|nr:SRPBCC family protein [Gammaproteobacteria bacterium]MCY4338483.1 SRPBCC family protein [Gammaproteobacteria bacterium]
MRLTWLLMLLLVLPGLATAHGPSRKSVKTEVTINAGAETVWALIKDFCSIAAWNPGVSACVAASPDQPQTIRTVTLADGQTLEEKLTRISPETMRIQYTLVKSNADSLPVRTMGSIMTVIPAADGASTLQYKAAFYRAYPGMDPPPELNDDACARAITALYEPGLNNIKKLAEQ